MKVHVNPSIFFKNYLYVTTFLREDPLTRMSGLSSATQRKFYFEKVMCGLCDRNIVILLRLIDEIHFNSDDHFYALDQ